MHKYFLLLSTCDFALLNYSGFFTPLVFTSVLWHTCEFLDENKGPSLVFFFFLIYLKLTQHSQERDDQMKWGGKKKQD